MAKYPFTNKELRDAVRIYAERRNAAMEELLDRDAVQFSPAFQHKMNELASVTDTAAAKSHPFRKRVAIAFLVVILLITAFFSFNSTARAEFVNWIKDVYKEFIEYRFFGEKTSDKISELIPGWLPDDLTLSLVKSTDPDHYSCMYENADKSLGFVISCYKAHSGSALSISDMDDKRDHFTMRIKDYDVDCYVSKSEASDYIWHSADEKLFFSMNSDLPHETNVKIIENLKIVQ